MLEQEQVAAESVENGDEPVSGWDIYRIAFSEDPHARWRALREERPVHDLGEGVFFVTDWANVDSILRDARHGAGIGVSASFGATDGLAFEAMAVWLMSLDGAPQTRARGLVRREFTPRRIEALRPRIEAATERLVSALETGPLSEPVDLIDRLAFALPSEITRSLFGISPDAWRAEVEPIVRARSDAPDAGIQMIEGLARYFTSILESGDVPDGLLSQLSVPDPELGRLSDLEIVANAVLLVTAAIDTTAGLIGSSILCALEHPEALTRLRKDPSLIPAWIEETLRFEPAALSCSRTAGEDFEIAGIQIPAGSQLLLSLGAANRDPNRYPNPDVFDLDRDHTGLLSFGGGRHVCLGAALARLEARVVLERLLVTSNLELEAIETPHWQTQNPTVRALERLPVRLHSRESLTGQTKEAS